jgi:hypothetical protein
MMILLLQSLRKSLIEGSIQPSDLVSMSANDLATEETRIARGKIAEEGFMERRSDMYEVKRSEIQAANGKLVSALLCSSSTS